MFVKLHPDKFKTQRIMLENEFITDYLPYAPELSVKAYLYGLSLALSGTDNSIEMIAGKLNVSTDEVLSAFKYWEDQNLVAILSLTPPLIEYKEIIPIEKQLKNYSKAKYKAFNDQLHAMLPNRTMLPNEYREYYNAIETLHIEKEAMLTIIAYCIRLKGEDIRSSYILAVARNLAAEGFITYERVNERLSELDLYNNEITAVLKALGIKRESDLEDKRLWLKWTRSLGFLQATIIKIAKNMKKGSIEKLDSALARYYKNHAVSYEEIEAFNLNQGKLYTLTAQILRTLCLHYERLEYIIETYTQKWLNYGFSDEALLKIADCCFKKNKRTLEHMDAEVGEFYQKGLLTGTDIEEYNSGEASKDSLIKTVLNKAGLERAVNSYDRDNYRIWTFSWNMPHDVIEYAAGLSTGKGMPYINGILANWNSKNIRTLEDAKKAGTTTVNAPPAAVSVTTKSIEELNALFKTISPEDI